MPKQITQVIDPSLADAGSDVQSAWSFKRSFAALSYPNYRLWFIGQMASLIGTFMQVTALGFLVFELTQSQAYLGYVGFASGLPAWFLMLYGGVISDRVSRRNLLMIVQFYMMILAFVLAFLTLSGLITPWHILLIALLGGIGNAFDAPARHSFVLEMVRREDLTNGIALNSIMFNSATMVGPAVAGILYATSGPGICFLVNAISYLAVVIALWKMRLPHIDKPSSGKSALYDLKVGIRYILSSHSILRLMGVTWMISLFGMSYVTLIPAWAVNVLGGDAATNGWLQSARGAGAFCGAFMIALLGRIQNREKLILTSSIAVPLLLVVFSFLSWVPISLLTLLAIGWAIMTVFNLVNATIQTEAPDHLRGRIMSVYSLVFFGSMPIGSLLAGAIAEWFGEPNAVRLTAVASLFMLWIVWHKSSTEP